MGGFLDTEKPPGHIGYVLEVDMLFKFVLFIPLCVVLISFAVSWLGLLTSLMKRGLSRACFTLLAGLLGPFGMFYWGLRVGIASFIGMAIFIIPWSFLAIPVNGWFHLVRTLVFLWMSLKINSLSDEGVKAMKNISFKAARYYTWEVIQAFLIYGVLAYFVIKLIY